MPVAPGLPCEDPHSFYITETHTLPVGRKFILLFELTLCPAGPGGPAGPLGPGGPRWCREGVVLSTRNLPLQNKLTLIIDRMLTCHFTCNK